MNFFAISGSVRQGSYNSALLEAMKNLCPEDDTFSVYKNLECIPAFNPDDEQNGLPGVVEELLVEIRKADAVVISTPEYAHGIPGALKNALDWVVSSDAVVLKPVVGTSVSSSGLGGVRSHAPLVLVLSAMNANVVVEGSFNVPFAQRKFDSTLKLIDEITISAIKHSFMALKQAVKNS